MRRPFNGTYPVTRPFGIDDPAYSNYPSSKHPGTDYGLPNNTPQVAAISGSCHVINRGNTTTGRGNEVWITNGTVQTRQIHLNTIDVKEGQHIYAGEPVGTTGWTGYVLPKSALGAHLHFEVLINGEYVDPETQYKENDMPNEGDVDNVYIEFNGRKATDEEKKVYTSKDWSAGDGLFYGKVLPEVNFLKTKLAESQNQHFMPVGELYVKKV